MTVSPSAPPREAGTSQPATRPARRRISASHLLVAVVVVLAFTLNLLALQDRTATVQVAVADRPISAGSTFSTDNVRTVEIAGDFEGLASLVQQSQLQSFEGWVVERFVPEGGLIDVSMLVEPGAPTGLRSMSIPVEVEHAAGGTIGTGDRIDIISVVDGAARYVTTDVEVLGVSETESGSFGAAGSYHIVVAVDAEQALELAQAIKAASIEIVRSTGAPKIEEGVGVGDS